jgi:predicted RNase H-like HicB family nuclease
MTGGFSTQTRWAEISFLYERRFFMRYVYPACFYPEPDGRYSVLMPDFPLATFGDDLVDALYMAADAAAGRLRLLLDEGAALPVPSDIRQVALEDPSGFVSLVYIDLASAVSASVPAAVAV